MDIISTHRSRTGGWAGAKCSEAFIVLVVFLLMPESSLWSQSAFCDNNSFMSVGTATGLPGQIVTVPLRGSSLCEVTGFGLAIGHDTSRLTYLDADPGQFLVNYAGLGMEFQEVGDDALGFMTLLVIFDFSPSLTIPPTTIDEGTTLATLDYRVKSDAPPGQALLRNETLTFQRPGFLPVANIFATDIDNPFTDGKEINPVLGSGSVLVLGGEIDCDSNAKLSVGTAAAVSGEVEVAIRGSSLCPVEGFQMAVGHDNTRVEFARVVPGPFLVDHAPDTLVVDSEAHEEEGFVELFVAFDLTPPIAAPPTSIGSNTLLLSVVYNILPGAPSGHVPLRNEDRTFGFPRVDNVFFNADGLVHPDLESGSITVVGQSECNQNADLSVGTATGAAGTQVQVPLAGSSVCAVNGFSLAVGHDNTRVGFVRATAGAFLNNYAGSDLLFLWEEHNSDGFMEVFGVFNATQQSQVPPTSIPLNTPLASLTYEIFPGSSGQVPLTNEDRAFGSPPIPNIFTTAGLSITPELHDGAIFIGTTSGGGCDENAVLSVGSANGTSGEVFVELRGSSACDVSGFLMAIGHDSTRVRFVDATPGSFLTNYSSELQFLSEPRNNQGAGIVFAAFDPEFPFTIPPTPVPADTRLATLRYTVITGAPSGIATLSAANQPLGFDNVFNGSDGPIHPLLVNGSITVGGTSPPPPPPPPPPVGDFAMTLDAPPSVDFTEGELDVVLTGSSTVNLLGFSALIDYDPDALTLASADFDGTVWESSDFRTVSDDGAGTLRIGVVHDRDGVAPPTSTVVSAGEDLAFLKLRFAGKCPGPTTLSFVGGIDDNQLVDEEFAGHDTGNGLALTGVAVSLEGGFVRGNANGGEVSPADPAASVDLADGLFILAYLFQDGAPPDCEDSADSNDDGRINLLDAILVFQFVIGNAGAELPAPFTSAGVDPTQDTLNCEILSDSGSCGQL